MSQGKKKKKAKPAFDRIELQAPPEWVGRLDATAARLGLSRSAFIRLACNKLMAIEGAPAAGSTTAAG